MHRQFQEPTHAGKPHVVIVGGGFGGLNAARSLGKAVVFVTLIDKRNFHLFQPLLYQVATGGLSPADISSPLRGVLKRQDSVQILQAEVQAIDTVRRRVFLHDGDIHYDYLVLATGATHHYFGHDEWATKAPGLKTVEDATSIRNRILGVFEEAEYELDLERRTSLMTFVVVGGGPTGVELAGAIGELATQTLRADFRNIDPRGARILLLEAGERILASFPERLSHRAVHSLARLGVEVRTRALVTSIEHGRLQVKHPDREESILADTVLWAAGVKASPLAESISMQSGAGLDRAGRLIVLPDCSVPGHPEIFVIGDAAHFAHQNGDPLPGVAPVAMQQGRYIGRAIRARVRGKEVEPFHYVDKGSLAVIGRAAAVAHMRTLEFSGYPAWLLWLFVHLMYLVGYDNRLLVFIQWALNYFTKNRGARLITEPCGESGERPEGKTSGTS